MDNPRPEKVAVVTEVRERFDRAGAAILTEYRGLTREGHRRRCGGRCARRAASTGSTRTPWSASPPTTSGSHELDALLTGPTAIAFVEPGGGRPGWRRRRGGQGPPGLRPDQPEAGREGRRPRQAGHVRRRTPTPWPTCPPARCILARLAGALAAPLQQFAGLLQAIPRNFAYGLQGPHRPGRAAPSAASNGSSATAEPATGQPSRPPGQPSRPPGPPSRTRRADHRDPGADRHHWAPASPTPPRRAGPAKAAIPRPHRRSRRAAADAPRRLMRPPPVGPAKGRTPRPPSRSQQQRPTPTPAGA